MTISELRKICQTSKNSPSQASQTIWGKTNRFFSIYLTWFFIKTPLTPNHITILGSSVFIVGCSLFVFQTTRMQLYGLALMVLAYWLDAVDGEVARFRNVMKKYDIGGVYVEPVSHDIQYACMLLPIGIGATLASATLFPLLASAIATCAKLTFRLAEFRLMAVMRHIDEVKGTTYGWKKQGAETPKTFVYSLYRNVSTVNGMMPLLFFAVLVHRVDIFLYFYAGIFTLLLVYKYVKNRATIIALSRHI